jgi:hypothetical protein
VNALSSSSEGGGNVQGMGQGDNEEIEGLLEHHVPILKRSRSEAFGQGSSFGYIDVTHCCKLTVSRVSKSDGVAFACLSCPEDADA